jgi:hypothetical protein
MRPYDEFGHDVLQDFGLRCCPCIVRSFSHGHNEIAANTGRREIREVLTKDSMPIVPSEINRSCECGGAEFAGSGRSRAGGSISRPDYAPHSSFSFRDFVIEPPN